jgi:ribulose-phosphate 3-epimerase
VNNITYGLAILEAVDKGTDMLLDVHLMIIDPLIYVERFAKCGADIITFHAEAGSDIAETIRAIRAEGKKPSVSIKPGTPASLILPYLKDIYMVLVMTVEPGFGGQRFIPETLEKITEIRREAEKRGLDLHIEVDGGINSDTAAAVKAAGADVLVSGSYLFNADDMCDTVTIIKEVN